MLYSSLYLKKYDIDLLEVDGAPRSCWIQDLGTQNKNEPPKLKQTHISIAKGYVFVPNLYNGANPAIFLFELSSENVKTERNSQNAAGRYLAWGVREICELHFCVFDFFLKVFEARARALIGRRRFFFWKSASTYYKWTKTWEKP